MESATILPLVSASANSGALSPTAGAPAAAGNWREAYNVAYAKSPAAPKLSTARIRPTIFPRYTSGFAKALRTPATNSPPAAASKNPDQILQFHFRLTFAGASRLVIALSP